MSKKEYIPEGDDIEELKKVIAREIRLDKEHEEATKLRSPDVKFGTDVRAFAGENDFEIDIETLKDAGFSHVRAVESVVFKYEKLGYPIDEQLKKYLDKMAKNKQIDVYKHTDELPYGYQKLAQLENPNIHTEKDITMFGGKGAKEIFIKGLMKAGISRINSEIAWAIKNAGDGWSEEKLKLMELKKKLRDQADKYTYKLTEQ